MERARKQNKFNLTFEEFCRILIDLSQIDVFGSFVFLKLHDFESSKPIGSHDIGINVALEMYEQLQSSDSEVDHG